jgi:surface antigen
MVARGDTLSRIAWRYGVSWQGLSASNHLANPNLIYRGQVICIMKVAGFIRQISQQHGPRPPAGARNFFPFGTCTWWADQRYFQLHGIFVPWKMQANAWQWVARAYQFGWRVSPRPSPGAIVVLQPWVEGAYGLGHVAVVERILPNGHVIASNMSWGWYPWRVTYVQFAPGPGVSFVSQ